ncbi:DUF362 domain-containing protein [Thiovibrio sp. JS02]
MLEGDAGKVFVREYRDWSASVAALLAAADFCARLVGRDLLLIKPNLVEALPPPITTPVALVAAIIVFLRKHLPGLNIVVAEGVGAKDEDSWQVFSALGYTRMAKELGVGLVDLNSEDLLCLERPGYRRFPRMYLPRLALDGFLLSVPVLKAHSLAGVTLTMKNMMGLAPPSHYQQGGHWKKAAFHTRIQEAICDLNRYRKPDFTILDATVGMSEAHLWGPTCNPPVNKLVAGYDPVSVDAYGAGLLGRDWRDIGHIRSGHGELGRAEPLHIIDCG